MGKYTIKDLHHVVEQKMRPPECDITMKVEVISANDGVAHGIWKVDQRFLNGHGVVMGGFISAAVDIIMAYAIASKLRNNQQFTSIDLDTTFHRPTMEGDVELIATVERKGRSIAYVTAKVKQEQKLVASCVSSIMIS